MLHELAHMWFGDSVSPYAWSDVWLNEGHAVWYELTYAEETRISSRRHRGRLPRPGVRNAGRGDARDVRARRRVAQEVGACGAAQERCRRQFYAIQIYDGGALVLYALRQKIGTAAFEQVERTWVQRYRDSVASTDDFIALATEVSGTRA